MRGRGRVSRENIVAFVKARFQDFVDNNVNSSCIKNIKISNEKRRKWLSKAFSLEELVALVFQ